jgi:hypothetical protein
VKEFGKTAVDTIKTPNDANENRENLTVRNNNKIDSAGITSGNKREETPCLEQQHQTPS